MDFDSFMARAWAEHADDTAAFAARLQAEAPALVQTDAQLVRLAALVHHVYGEHLARWGDGQRALQGLAALPACRPDGEAAPSLRRCVASLQLSAGSAGGLDGLNTSDAVRVQAMAAANLGGHDALRAANLLAAACASHEAAALDGSDPATRTLATTGWNIACTLEGKTERNASERALMTHAAEISRRYWERAGTWLEVERGEYRLAISWLAAGEPARGRGHAQNCLDIVTAHDGPALERFFAWEALGRVARAQADDAGHKQAVAQAQAAFEALDDADRGWVQPSLAAMTS